MPQVKKPEIRVAILDAAKRRFARKGYANTTLQQIARAARVSTANVYVYFGSKLDILYEIYAPWMRDRLTRLATELRAIPDRRERLRRLLRTLWREIPAAEGGFAINIMQAISSMSREDGYKPELLDWMEGKLARLLAECLPPRRRGVATDRLAHLLVMALDGFILYRHVDAARPCDDAMLDLVCSLVLGDPLAGVKRAAPRARPRASARRRRGGHTSRSFQEGSRK
jgi:AcrR family transcriptional regulator